ncbi:MAG TPA: serine/threonine-protein kinase, partial [Longimicrobium sp.]|nr:serine/threonine-protein kinase [Longimicrobium sp.]
MAGIESLLRGRVLNDRYRVEEVIGRGGMGAVYRATDERLGRPVAVKVITAAAGGDEGVRERIRARFRHEAASAARLPHHPNVVPVYDYGTDEALGLDFIVMELLRGEDLASRLSKAGPPPLALSVRILRDAARGIAVGHRSGLIHRDVKPGNVFLVADEDEGAELQVRVLDFGIAKAMADEDTQTALTQDGRAPLSPAYASPEQLRGEARLTPASDVFSLGALAFQLLTGEKPFTENDRNRLSIGMEVPLPSVRARNPAVPPPVEAIVRRALAFDPAERFANATAMAEALDAVLRGLEGSPAAAAIPAVAGPVVTSDADDDDDRTALAGD